MHELNHSNVLTSYHLKTVFFWQCEKIPASEWSTDTGLAVNLLWLLDELVYCVATHCLSHYFIAANNLFDHINPDFLSDVARTLSRIRRDPLRHVLAFNKRFRFRFSVVSCDLANILGHIIDVRPNRLAEQWFALEELGKQHMREKRYGEAYCVFAQLLQIRHRFIDSDATPCSQMSIACLELEAEQALNVFEYLVATFPDDLHIYSLLGNLACMYHSAAFAADNEDTRQEMLQKADENFVKSMACCLMNVTVNHTDYSMFLLHSQRYEEATIVLEQVISSECHNPVAINSYQENERNTVEDENLINEINHHSNISTFSVGFAYYLLAKIYCDSGRQRDAMTLLPDFHRLCNNTLVEGATDSTLHARAFSLLGYSYLAVQDYSKAGQAFGKAAQLADGYTLAEENRASCDVLRLCTLTWSDEDVCFNNREAASLKTPKKNFVKKIACSGGNVSGSQIGYRIFRLHLLPSEEAIVVLKQIICSERHKPVAVICYRVGMRNTTEDTNLINEITIHGRFFTFSVAFAYYFLAKIYCDSGRQREAETLLPDFQRLCNNTLAKGRYCTVYARAYSLLGYSYMAVHDNSKAAQAFGKAAELAGGTQSYALAELNRAWCEAHKQRTEARCDDVTMSYDEQRAHLGAQYNALFELGIQHMRENRYEEATCVFTQRAQIENHLINSDSTPCNQMSRALLKLEAAQALGVLEYLVATFPDDEDIHSLLGNLACMYHSSAFAAGNEDKRQEMLQKAEENFVKAVSCSGVNVAASQVDYSFFLLHLHRYEEAITVLKQVISSEGDSPVAGNGYGNNERNTIEDGNLINEINRHGNIITFTAAFAYYLLAKLYYNIGRQRESEKLLPDFHRLCNNTLVEGATDSTLHARAYSLLGYSYTEVQDYSKAEQAFGKAAQLADDYTLAEENRASCDVFRRYTLARSDEDVCFYNRETASLEKKCASCDVLRRRVFECLIATFPDDLHIHSLLVNLACMYHSAAFAAGNEDKRQEMLQKAEENFLKAMACSGVNVAASQVDYSMFLLHLHRYEEATTVLKQVISSECQNPVAGNAYGDSERNTIEDKNLINEINRHGNISTFSVAFAYYLLANIYYDIGRHKEAQKLLPDFHRLCNNTLAEGATDSTMHALAYVLLCYLYVAVEEYSKAKQALGRAAQLADAYTPTAEKWT